MLLFFQKRLIISNVLAGKLIQATCLGCWRSHRGIRPGLRGFPMLGNFLGFGRSRMVWSVEKVREGLEYLGVILTFRVATMRGTTMQLTRMLSPTLL